MSEIPHHPVIRQFDPAEAAVPDGCALDYFGMLTVKDIDRINQEAAANDPTPFNNQEIYRPQDVRDLPKSQRRSEWPNFNEEYFESIDLIESIMQSGDRYVMFELGAGYGRWGIRAYQFVRRHFPKKQAHILFAEAEPVHFDDLKYHLKLNNVNENDATLVEAAVSDKDQPIPFYVRCSGLDHPHLWYGQAINHHLANFDSNDFKVGTYNGRPMYHNKSADQAYIKVQCSPLSRLVQRCPQVDLIDMDIQGDEAKAVIEALDELNRRVKRLHIGTHGHEIEDQLRKALSEQNWTCLWDYPCQQKSDTPFGEIEFGDGVQSWVNPRLA